MGKEGVGKQTSQSWVKAGEKLRSGARRTGVVFVDDCVSEVSIQAAMDE